MQILTPRGGLVSFFLLFLFLSSTAAASDEEKQKGFARHLFHQGEYFRAITEAERYLFLFPHGPHAEEMEILIADSYREGGDHEGALSRYSAFLRQYPGSSLVPEVFYKIALLYSENRDYPSARTNMEHVLANPHTSETLRRKAQQWVILLTLLADGERNEVQSLLESFVLLDDPDMKGMVAAYENLDIKSPTSAGVLSALVPGAGQLYLGRKRDALAALILNGLFIWGIVESFDNDKVALGVLLTVFEIGWYGGNIYTAVNGAHKHNRKLKDSFKHWYAVGLNLNAREHHDQTRIMVSFRYAF